MRPGILGRYVFRTCAAAFSLSALARFFACLLARLALERVEGLARARDALRVAVQKEAQRLQLVPLLIDLFYSYSHDVCPLRIYSLHDDIHSSY